MASRWNLWVWLDCIGVVSGCCCKEVYRYPHNNYYFPYSTFFGSSIPTFLFNFFPVLFNIIIPENIQHWVNKSNFYTGSFVLLNFIEPGIYIFTLCALTSLY